MARYSVTRQWRSSSALSFALWFPLLRLASAEKSGHDQFEESTEEVSPPNFLLNKTWPYDIDKASYRRREEAKISRASSENGRKTCSEISGRCRGPKGERGTSKEGWKGPGFITLPRVTTELEMILGFDSNSSRDAAQRGSEGGRATKKGLGSNPILHFPSSIISLLWGIHWASIR